MTVLSMMVSGLAETARCQVATPPIATNFSASVIALRRATSGSPPIRVGGNSQYATIQQGVQAAEIAGSHRVVVGPGTYTETVALGSLDDGLTIAAGSAGVTLAGSIGIAGASSITVSGLTFQGDGSTVAIDALNSQKITIADDTFAGVGQAVLLDGSSLCSITRNLVTNATNSAIEMKDASNGDTVINNVVNGDGAAGTIGAIWLHGTAGSNISHNTITNTAGAAISLTDFNPPGSTATQNNGATIAYNMLVQVDTMSEDSGAIYVLGRSQTAMTSITVTMNVVAQVGSPGAHAVGIYLDDNASGVVVRRNVIQAGATMSDVFEIHGGSNDTISGNIFDLGSGATDAGLFQQDEADQQPQGSFTQLQNDVVSGNIYTTESANPHDPSFADLTGMIGNVLISGNDFWAYSGVALNVAGAGAQGDTAPKYNPPAPTGAQAISDYSTWNVPGIGFKAIDTSHAGSSRNDTHAH